MVASNISNKIHDFNKMKMLVVNPYNHYGIEEDNNPQLEHNIVPNSWYVVTFAYTPFI